MINKSCLEIQKFKNEKLYSRGEKIWIAGLIPAALLFIDFGTSDFMGSNPEFMILLSLKIVIFGFLIIFGSCLQNIAIKRLKLNCVQRKTKYNFKHSFPMKRTR